MHAYKNSLRRGHYFISRRRPLTSASRNSHSYHIHPGGDSYRCALCHFAPNLRQRYWQYSIARRNSEWTAGRKTVPSGHPCISCYRSGFAIRWSEGRCSTGNTYPSLQGGY